MEEAFRHSSTRSELLSCRMNHFPTHGIRILGPDHGVGVVAVPSAGHSRSATFPSACSAAILSWLAFSCPCSPSLFFRLLSTHHSPRPDDVIRVAGK